MAKHDKVLGYNNEEIGAYSFLLCYSVIGLGLYLGETDLRVATND